MVRYSFVFFGCAASALVSASGCSNGNDSGQTSEESATLAVKTYLQGELVGLAAAAAELENDVPDPDDDGWNITDDRAAVEKMRSVWSKTRDDYEHVEGAIAELFMELDVSTDERYDAFIENNGPDDNLFDDENVTGMHAIERILWADSQPANVVKFESALLGYKAAAFPSNRVEATDFKQKLVARLTRETASLRDQFGSKRLALDPTTAYSGVVGSMKEQFEKVNKAATASDESRYAQRTLDDMRANLVGGEKVYAAFRDWVTQTGGAALNQDILDGFARLDDAYRAIDGAAIPPVPDGFDSLKPSAKDLDTPYGKLWQLLTDEGDATRDGSLVHAMVSAADGMGIQIQQ
jgi:iron uptake system component EfeO